MPMTEDGPQRADGVRTRYQMPHPQPPYQNRR
jgi:transcription initiation factor TFIID TATA-box-binding protein